MGRVSYWRIGVVFLVVSPLCAVACDSRTASVADASPADASVADASPADASPADASPDARPTHVEITVTTTGAGHGEIIAAIASTVCDSACLASVPFGAVVDFTTTADAGSWFHGWVAGCDGRHACRVVATRDVTITGDFAPEPNRVFVSSAVNSGNFGGIAGGDAICQGLAVNAGLAGTYHILLSTTAADWTTRIAGARGWIRVDGEPVGDQTVGTSAGLYNIRLDEHGTDVGLSTYWSVGNTLTGGTTCSAWTSSVGGSTADTQANFAVTTQSAKLGGPFTDGVDACNVLHRFLCAEVDRNVEIARIATSGRLAFMTRTAWDTTTGLAAADQLCASEAGGASKVGTFKALLPTSTASAISRFDTSGPPWVRADGTPLLVSAKSFESARFLDVAPGVRIDGTLEPFPTAIAFGGTDFHSITPLDSTCNDWSPGPATESTGFSPWFTMSNELQFGCFQWRLLCLQE